MKTHPQQSRREEYAEATRHALIAAARVMFTERGYQATNIEAIARAARVTRGAFYYHFTDKKALFEAVVILLQAEAAQAVATQARTVEHAWAQLQAGIIAYLDVCIEPAYRRLVIQEAPVVLGTTRARQIDDGHTLALLMASLKALRLTGELDCDEVELFSRMLGAMICEVALLLPDSALPMHVQEQALTIVARILRTFRRAAAV